MSARKSQNMLLNENNCDYMLKSTQYKQTTAKNRGEKTQQEQQHRTPWTTKAQQKNEKNKNKQESSKWHVSRESHERKETHPTLDLFAQI